MIRFIGTFILCLLISSQAFANELTAKVNRSQIPLGETFLLTLETPNNPNGAAPDFAPLKKDFIVYSVEQGISNQYINGKYNTSHRWNVAIAPKSLGDIVIPPLSLDGKTSSQIIIKVIDGNSEQAQSTDAPKFWIKSKIDKQNPFVQEQIIYSLTISMTEPLRGNMPQFLSEEVNNDWSIMSLGEPVRSVKISNGKEITSYEFRYAFFAQRSGKLTIPEARFDGYYEARDESARGNFRGMLNQLMLDPRSGFDAFVTKKPVYLSAKPIDIEVKAAIASQSNWWLPAKNLKISSSWQEAPPSFEAGEATNREIVIKAVGVLDSQLPNIEFLSVNGIKQYPEKAIIESVIEGNDIVSIMKINNVYIPEKSGKLEIPAIEIEWYNTTTNKLQKSSLANKIVEVKKGKLFEEDTSNTLNTYQKDNVAQSNLTPLEPQKSLSLVYVVMIVVFAFLGGILASYFVLKPQKTVQKTQEPSFKKIDVKDIKSIRDSVLSWAKKHYANEQINNLDDVVKRTKDVELEFELKLLNQALYSSEEAAFDSKRFLEVFARVNKGTKKSSKNKSLLPDLYK